MGTGRALLAGAPLIRQDFQCIRRMPTGIRRVDDVVDQAPGCSHEWRGEGFFVQGDKFFPCLAGSSASAISLRNTTLTAVAYPITAISAVEPDKGRSAPRSFEHMARWAPP